jgi:hypothetical protein
MMRFIQEIFFMNLLHNMAFGGALFSVLVFLGCGQQGSAPEAASAADLPNLTLAISGMT